MTLPIDVEKWIKEKNVDCYTAEDIRQFASDLLAEVDIRRRDDVIAEMRNRIAELEAEKETREYVGPIELAPHVWAESDEAIAKLEAERRS